MAWERTGLLKFAFWGAGVSFFCILRVLVYREGKEKYGCFGFRVYHNV